MKKLIPAICMLLVTAVMLGSSTFAWFSMNNTVKVTGMEVTTRVSNNLYIAEGTAGTTVAAEANFQSGYNKAMSSAVILQPVSTVNGRTFFYTYDAESNGALSSDGKYYPVDNAETDTEETAIKDAAGTNTLGVAYVDYVFDLKAMNSGTTANKILLSKLNLLYNNQAIAGDSEKAYRVAIFAQKETAAEGDGTTLDALAATADAIYSISGAKTQTALGSV